MKTDSIILTLDELVEKYSEMGKTDFECKQIANALKQLREYKAKDTPVKVKHGNLAGKFFCPVCEEPMALSAKNYCDKCGQRIEQ